MKRFGILLGLLTAGILVGTVEAPAAEHCACRSQWQYNYKYGKKRIKPTVMNELFGFQMGQKITSTPKNCNLQRSDIGERYIFTDFKDKDFPFIDEVEVDINPETKEICVIKGLTTKKSWSALTYRKTCGKFWREYIVPYELKYYNTTPFDGSPESSSGGRNYRHCMIFDSATEERYFGVQYDVDKNGRGVVYIRLQDGDLWEDNDAWGF